MAVADDGTQRLLRPPPTGHATPTRSLAPGPCRNRRPAAIAGQISARVQAPRGLWAAVPFQRGGCRKGHRRGAAPAPHGCGQVRLARGAGFDGQPIPAIPASRGSKTAAPITTSPTLASGPLIPSRNVHSHAPTATTYTVANAARARARSAGHQPPSAQRASTCRATLWTPPARSAQRRPAGTRARSAARPA